MTTDFNAIELFSQLLNFGPNWAVSSITSDESKNEIHVNIDYVGKTAICPKTGEVCSIYDRRPERQWRHLDTWHYKTFFFCKVPRVKNSLGEVSTIDVPWANATDRTTFFFSDLQ